MWRYESRLSPILLLESSASIKYANHSSFFLPTLGAGVEGGSCFLSASFPLSTHDMLIIDGLCVPLLCVCKLGSHWMPWGGAWENLKA